MNLPQKQLTVKQEVDMLEVFTGINAFNKYLIFDGQQQAYYAYEDSSALSRLFSRSMRNTSIHIIDGAKQTQLSIDKKFGIFSAPFEVTSPVGTLLATIKSAGFFQKKVKIISPQGNVLFECVAPISHPLTFTVSKQGVEVATITKQWGGLIKEMATDADSFLIDFGSVIDMSEKELILASTLVIDFIFFESGKHRKSKGPTIKIG